MSDDKTKLTTEDKQKIVEWFAKRQGTLGCPWCHQKNLSIADQLAAAPIATISEGIQLGPHYPLVVLICTNCAHTIFFGTCLPFFPVMS